jgi:hypothetical protein
MPICSCERQGERELYFCKEILCATSQHQQYYCVRCAEESGKHEHRLTTIKGESDRHHQQWVTVNNEIYTTVQAGKAFFEKYANVVKYLDHLVSHFGLSSEDVIPFSQDFEQLMSLQTKVDRVFLEVQKAHLTSNLRALIKLFSKHFQDISMDSSKFMYFNDLGE